MSERTIQTATYGDLGKFRRIRPGQYQSASGRLQILGQGCLGGKGEGLAMIDRHQLAGFNVPRSTLIGADYFGLSSQPVDFPAAITALAPERVSNLIDILARLNYSSALAIRSSALAEDQPGATGAGTFTSEFHALPLNTPESRRRFVDKLLSVQNSGYTPRAVQFWRRHGYSEIPPLSVIVEEVVGRQWESAPRYFLPAISGIVNTASRKFVRVATVLGLGLAAVSAAGPGTLHKLPLGDSGTVYPNLGEHRGGLNLSDIYCLDLESGEVVRLKDSQPALSFPNDLLASLTGTAPETQVALANLGLQLEREYESAFDLEWASHDGNSLTIVQARPINKKALLARPNIAPGNLVLQSDQVVGCGVKTFDRIIYISAKRPQFNWDVMEGLGKKYPLALIVFETDMVEDITGPEISEFLLPFFEAVLVLDSRNNHTWYSTGLQHLALDCADEGKIVVYSEGDQELRAAISKRAYLVERIECPSINNGWIEVQILNQPVSLAADDELDWGYVYFAG